MQRDLPMLDLLDDAELDLLQDEARRLIRQAVEDACSQPAPALALVADQPAEHRRAA